MKNERWQLVEHLYHAALEQDSGARAAFLATACNGDEALHREVAALLKYDHQARHFIETPALELEARALAADPPAEKPGLEANLPSRIGQYELLTPLGRGGMGEVHLALDQRLKRKVAIKLLPAELTAEVEWARRFEQEAQAASALNHPNTLTIYEIGEIENRHYMVTEFIEGETLRQRMERAPQKKLGLTESIKIAAQVASALDAAHQAGIIHRDIKPENIMVRKDGLVKVLDFGLAKMSRIQVESQSFKSEKLSTRSGIVMGTVTYMSPEQARGQKVDYRTDMFSLGVTLYEMLAGQKPFDGPSISDVIVAVLTKDAVPLRQLDPEVPVALEAIVSHCLEKEPEKRFQSAGDLRFALEAFSSPAEAQPKTVARGLRSAEFTARLAKRLPRLHQSRFSWIMRAVVAILFIAATILAVIHFGEQPEEKLAASFTFNLPENWSFRWFDAPAVSPDGKYIVYGAQPASEQQGRNGSLWLRRLDSTEAKALPGTEGAISPFWSPDSRFVAFFVNGRLQKIDILGGSAVTVCESKSSLPGTWNQEGVILFSPEPFLHRVTATGGRALRLEPFAEGEMGQQNPRFLPDARHFLYCSRNRDAQKDGIYIASLDSNKERKLVMRDAESATYVAPGYLLFTKGDMLMAQRFDLKRMEITGEPVLVAERVASYTGNIANYNGNPPQPAFAAFSASENGVLVWKVKTDETVGTQLTWFDRSGKRLGTLGEIAGYSGPAFSPDDRRLAIARLDPRIKSRDLWIMDIFGGAGSRLTFEPADDLNAVWTPDGKWIIYTSTPKGTRNIYRKLVNGGGEAELLLESEGDKAVEDITSDGKYLLYNYHPPDGGDPDLYYLSLTGDRKPVSLSATEFREDQAQFSPNGRWIAYRSDENKGSEVYVRGFTPNGSAAGNKWQVSDKGGCQPRWRGDGQELFYINNSMLMAVDVKTDGATFSAGAPRPLFSVNIEPEERRNRFVVTKDGQRFLFLSLTGAIGGSTVAVQLNWLADLRR